MPALNIRHRQPVAALWYSSLGALVLAALVLVVGAVLATSQAVANATAGNDSVFIICIALLLAAITVAYPVLYYFLFTFEFSEQSVTVKSGIFFREYETINFDRIQVIDNERGPLLMLFGLTEVRIWTASPDQYNVEHAGHLDPKPDASMLLAKSDAEAVKQFITRTHSPSGGL